MSNPVLMSEKVNGAIVTIVIAQGGSGNYQATVEWPGRQENEVECFSTWGAAKKWANNTINKKLENSLIVHK